MPLCIFCTQKISPFFYFFLCAGHKVSPLSFPARAGHTENNIKKGITMMQSAIHPDADLLSFAHGDTSTLRALPRMLPTGVSHRPPMLPTALDMEMMLQKPPVNGITQARALYSVTTNRKGVAQYVSVVGIGMSRSAVISLSDTKGKILVSKVSMLEKMPWEVERAYLTLVEMSMSIIVTDGLSMVSLADVARASRVLFSISKPQIDFDTQAVHALLPDTALPVCDQPSGVISDQFYPPIDETAGDAYFDMEHLVAAVRLYTLIIARMDEDGPLALIDVDAAFGRFLIAAVVCGITTTTVLTMSVPRGPRSYAHIRNAEHVNEIVASSRVTLMFYTRTAVGFTPVMDYFYYHPSEASSAIALHVATPVHVSTTQKLILDACDNILPTLSGLNMVRSLLAQVLLTLESAQTILRFVHCDLHLGNVMADVVTKGMPEYGGSVWRYTRPEGAFEFFIPASDSNNHAARMIDFGRSRCDDPRFPCDDVRACFVTIHGRASSHVFDHSVDTRSLGHDIIMFVLGYWYSELVLCHKNRESYGTSNEPVEKGLSELLDVLEAMVGIKWWKGWADGSSEDRYGTKLLDSCGAFIELLASNKLSLDTTHKMREDEFFIHRPPHEYAPRPTDILNMAFFAPYHQAVGNDVVHVADATASMKMEDIKNFCAPSTEDAADDDAGAAEGDMHPPGSAKKRKHRP